MNSYIQLCEKSDGTFKNWVCAIHTDSKTFESYDKEFFRTILENPAVVVGISTPNSARLDELSTKYVSIHSINYLYYAILRLNRFYPLFIQEKSVFVRDADTLFPEYLEEIDLLAEHDPRIVKTVEIAKFVGLLNKYETLLFNKISTRTPGIYFTWDAGYFFSVLNEFNANFRPTNIKNWHLRPALRVAFVSDFKVSLAAARRTFKTGIPLVCRF